MSKRLHMINVESNRGAAFLAGFQFVLTIFVPNFNFPSHLRRLGLGFSGADVGGYGAGPSMGAQLEYSYLLHSIFGLGAFSYANGSAVGGGIEAELVPIRIDIFGKEDFLEAAVMADGLMNIGYSSSGVHFAPHLGIRTQIHWTENFGFVSTVRWSDYQKGASGSELSGLAGRSPTLLHPPHRPLELGVYARSV